jgi:hypothetical protein
MFSGVFTRELSELSDISGELISSCEHWLVLGKDRRLLCLRLRGRCVHLNGLQ